MYEQYTDKQIVEMLKPKLNKCTAQINWDVVTSEPDSLWGQMFWRDILKAISIVYRSSYIRGQLGRSFIIGEPKQTQRWVPATKNNVKVGSKIRMIDDKGHRSKPWCFPDVGTVGTVMGVGFHISLVQWPEGSILVQWPKGTTSRTDKWYCDNTRLEVLLCE